VLEQEAYYNPTQTFHNLLTIHLGGGQHIEEYLYTSREKRRIFRRRPPEWIARWKRIYVKKLKLKLAIKARRSKEKYKALMATEINRSNYFFDQISKRDSAWSGSKVTIPIKGTK
jgi:hypothetical protein